MLPAGLYFSQVVPTGENDRVSRKFLTINHTTKGHQNYDKNSICAAPCRSRTDRRCLYGTVRRISGQIQIRFAEVFTLLPLFTPAGIWGVTLGCALSNLYGLALGTNIIGIWDVFLGTGATFVAAVLTYKFRDIRFKGLPLLSALMPVLLNALVVGGELTLVMSPTFDMRIFWLNFGSVGLGEFIACFVIGLPMYRYLQSSGLAFRIFSNLD